MPPVVSSIKKLLCTTIMLFGGYVFSQEQILVSDEALAEKIYLQIDSESYVNNGTIWLKALVVNAVNHKPTQRSGVLYVELINPFQEIIQQKKLKIEDGVASNSFDLNPSYPEGRYQLRAYTRWNLNFGNDFIFTKYINVFSTVENEETSAINDFTASINH